jgi:hypothetical protein
MLVVAFTLAVSGATAMAAGTGYAPPPPSTTVPGGFNSVIASYSFGPAGGTQTNIALGNNTSLNISVPPGTFTSDVTLTIFSGDLVSVGNAGFSGYEAVSGFRFLVTEGSSRYSGSFNNYITFTLTSSNITSSSKVLIFNGTSFVSYPNSSVKNGQATIQANSDPEFVVVSPVVTPAVVPSSTTVTTGKPFLGEEILAGILFLAGLVGLSLGLRKRSHAES